MRCSSIAARWSIAPSRCRPAQGWSSATPASVAGWSPPNTTRAAGNAKKASRCCSKVLPGITALRDVTPEQLEAHKALLPEIVYRRCRHVVTEDARVMQAVDAMEAGDLAQLGELLNASHESLRDDYAVSCPELDTMVELARQQPGVYGSRMTGAGFGGCTISLVADQHATAFAAAVAPAYKAATGLEPQIYICTASAGAGEVKGEE